MMATRIAHDGQPLIITIYDQGGQVVWFEHVGEGEILEYWEKHIDLPQNQFYFLAAQVGADLVSTKIVVQN